MSDKLLEEANRRAHKAARAALRVQQVYAKLPESVGDLNPALIARDRALGAYEEIEEPQQAEATR